MRDIVYLSIYFAPKVRDAIVTVKVERVVSM